MVQNDPTKLKLIFTLTFSMVYWYLTDCLPSTCVDFMITPCFHPYISGFLQHYSKVAPPTAVMSSSDFRGLPCGLAWLISFLALNLSNLSLKGTKEAFLGTFWKLLPDHLVDVPDIFKARREISHAKPQGWLSKSEEDIIAVGGTKGEQGTAELGAKTVLKQRNELCF